MANAKERLLAGTIFSALAIGSVHAAPLDGVFVVAQAPQGDHEKEKARGAAATTSATATSGAAATSAAATGSAATATLKVPTPGPERANRRVTVRRITPLLTGQNQAIPLAPR